MSENTTYSWELIRLLTKTNERFGESFGAMVNRFINAYKNIKDTALVPVEKMTAISIGIPEKIPEMISIVEKTVGRNEAEKLSIEVVKGILDRANTAGKAYEYKAFMESAEAKNLYEEFLKKKAEAEKTEAEKAEKANKSK